MLALLSENEMWEYDYRSDVGEAAVTFEGELSMTFFEDGTLECQRRLPAGRDAILVYCADDSDGPPGRLSPYQITDEFISPQVVGSFGDGKWQVNISDTTVLEGTYTQDGIAGGSTEERTGEACSDTGVDGGPLTVVIGTSFEIPRTTP